MIASSLETLNTRPSSFYDFDGLGDSMKRAARILIVEDERDVALSLTKRLKHSGFDVQIAEDGVAATSAAMRFLPDVILLDIGVPCGDGFVIADRLKGNVTTCAIPIIFLTARTSEGDRDRAEKLGAFSYLTKPFKSEELLLTIREAISR